MPLTSQFTQAPPIARPCPGPLPGRRRLRLAILAVTASLLTFAPAPSWAQQGGDLRDALRDLNETILESEARRQHDELWDLSYQGDDRVGKDERWVLPRPGPHGGSGQQQRTGLAASPLTVALAPSSEQQGSNLRDDIARDRYEEIDDWIGRDPWENFLEDTVAELFFPPHHEERSKTGRWTIDREQLPPPPGPPGGSGQQQRTTSVPNLLDPFRTAGGGGQSQRTGAASAAPGRFDAPRSFNPPDRLGGSARQRSPAGSSNRIFRGMSSPGGADRRPRN